MLRFIAWLKIAHFSAQHISAHLAAVRNWHITSTQHWCGRTERIRLALKALARAPKARRRQRLPLTVTQLLSLRRRLRRSGMQKRDRRVAWAAVSLGFFGALRGSEYMAPGPDHFSRRRTCLRRHLTLQPDKLTLQIPASKTDQTFIGHVVSLPQLSGAACPVKAMTAYLRCKPAPKPSEPLLSRHSGKYATIAWLNGLLRRYLPSGHGRYTTHSLRIGFATAAAAAGVPDATIQAAGRWRGDTFRQYIRGAREDVWQACLRVHAARTALAGP